MKCLVAIAAAVVATAACLVFVSGASARVQRNPVEVDCGTRGSFQVVGNGDGGRSDFSAAHVVETHMTVVAVSFSNQHVTLTDTEGNSESFDPDDVSKGTGPANADLLSCHFTFHAVFPEGTVDAEGDVVLFITGNR